MFEDAGIILSGHTWPTRWAKPWYTVQTLYWCTKTWIPYCGGQWDHTH